MERFVFLFCALILGMMGLALPFFAVYANLSLRGGFWLGFMAFCVSLFLMFFFLLFSAVLMEGAFPGTWSKASHFKNKINNLGYMAGDIFVSILFRLGFAGEFSRWKMQPDHKAGILDGFWHGTILPLSMHFRLFSSRIRPYESANQGLRYIIGYIAGGSLSYLIVFEPETMTFRISLFWIYVSYVVFIGLAALFVLGVAVFYKPIASRAVEQSSPFEEP